MCRSELRQFVDDLDQLAQELVDGGVGFAGDDDPAVTPGGQRALHPGEDGVAGGQALAGAWRPLHQQGGSIRQTADQPVFALLETVQKPGGLQAPVIRPGSESAHRAAAGSGSSGGSAP